MKHSFKPGLGYRLEMLLDSVFRKSMREDEREDGFYIRHQMLNSVRDELLTPKKTNHGNKQSKAKSGGYESRRASKKESTRCDESYN